MHCIDKENRDTRAPSLYTRIPDLIFLNLADWTNDDDGKDCPEYRKARETTNKFLNLTSTAVSIVLDVNIDRV